MPTLATVLAVALLTLHGSALRGASAPPSTSIYQSPLTVALPASPQVMIAIANSQSMDGDLFGAIRTGSGSLGNSLSELRNTVSPVNFTVPTAFVPPVTGGAVGSSQPYTSTVSGNLVDNSPSRLNLAKAGLTNILNSFMANTDFALMTYNLSGMSRYTTWVYYMSPTGGFTVATSVPAGQRGVPNPCYNVNLSSGTTIANECQALSGSIPSINQRPWLLVSASSDDANINDVLYASGGIVPLCMVYNGPSPATPYPPNYTLGNYNSGSILERYSSQLGGGCATATGPTNAGYVPYSSQVMYVERGFGFYSSSQSATTGTVLVPMASSGSNPTAATVQTQINKFLPYLAPETNNTSTTEIKAGGTQAPTAGLLTGAKNYFQNSNPPSSNGCTPTRYVVLVTDGLPTMDLAGKFWPPLGTVSAAGYGVTATFNPDGSLATTNDQALTDTVTVLTSLRNAGIKTYIIGVGAGVNSGANATAASTLTAMAIAGGTNTYFPATDPAQLTSAMQVILAAIQSGTQSVSAAAVNSTSIHAGAMVYQAQFSTSDDSQDWSGNLYAFPIDPNTGAVNTSPAAAQWATQPLLDARAPSTRYIATWDPVAGTAIPFEWSGGTPATGIASSTALGQALSGSVYDSSGAHALSYLRGDQTLAYNNGGPYRARAHVLGDIVDSAPLYIGQASGSYSRAGYAAFATAMNSRPPIVYVGANDGMLHAFRASDGREMFAYVPRGVFSNLLGLTDRYYATNHHFYVDGSPAAGDVYYGGAWHTVLAGGLGAGGNSVYALDVTHPENITGESALASAVLWDFTDGNMGLSFSRPVVTNLNAGAVVAFGNGYNSPTQTPFLYVLNAQTGVVLRKLDLCALVTGVCSATAANGLSSVTAVNTDGDLSSNSTLLYAGDLQGNVWRIDVSNADPTQWTASVLFQARSAGGVAQPITTAPAVSLNPRYPRLVGEMVMFGTGQLLGVGDLSSTASQSIYGIYDNNSASATPIVRANLVGQTLSNMTINFTDGTTGSGRIASSNAVTLPTSKGWYVDLGSAERVVTEAQVDSGALLATSVQPAGNLCTGGMTSWLNLLNYATGGAVNAAPFEVTTQVVSSMSLGQTFASSPRLELFQHGQTTRDVLVTVSGTGTGASPIGGQVPIRNFNMLGRTTHRASWTELH